MDQSIQLIHSVGYRFCLKIEVEMDSSIDTGSAQNGSDSSERSKHPTGNSSNKVNINVPIRTVYITHFQPAVSA